jgi:hypothetical protein
VLPWSPSESFKNKSRLYFYKVQGYSKHAEIKQDMGWRELEEIEKHVLAVKWIPLEELIKIFYNDFNHTDKEEAMSFFRERNLA